VKERLDALEIKDGQLENAVDTLLGLTTGLREDLTDLTEAVQIFVNAGPYATEAAVTSATSTLQTQINTIVNAPYVTQSTLDTAVTNLETAISNIPEGVSQVDFDAAVNTITQKNN